MSLRVQRQTTVTAHLKRKQLLMLVFSLHNAREADVICILFFDAVKTVSQTVINEKVTMSLYALIYDVF